MLHLFRSAHCVKYPHYCKSLQHEHAQVPGFSVESPVHAYSSLLLHLLRPAHCVKYPECCKSLQHRHAQIPAFSDESPVHTEGSLLFHLFRPTHCVKYPDCYFQLTSVSPFCHLFHSVSYENFPRCSRFGDPMQVDHTVHTYGCGTHRPSLQGVT